MRILIRTSKWATWARRLGSVSVPLLVLPVLLHHLRLIGGDAFAAAMASAGAAAALAVLAAVIGLVRLWYTGDQGWGRALAGLLLGGICLVPFAWFGSLAMRYPMATDVASVERGELPLVFDPETAQMPPPALLTPQQQDEAFPNAKTRTYPLGLFQTFGVVRNLVEERGWQVVLLTEPGQNFSPGRINARIATLPGWREEVVVRVTGTADRAAVDMRSASLNARLDFGSNGTRIEEFMVALDEAVTTLLRDNPNANQPVEVEAEAEPADETAPAQ